VLAVTGPGLSQAFPNQNFVYAETIFRVNVGQHTANPIEQSRAILQPN